MTPKEKANELVDKFARIDGYQDSTDLSTCLDEIEYALIAVDEIIEQWSYIYTYIGNMGGQLNPNLKHWIEVRVELLKMK